MKIHITRRQSPCTRCFLVSKSRKLNFQDVPWTLGFQVLFIVFQNTILALNAQVVAALPRPMSRCPGYRKALEIQIASVDPSAATAVRVSSIDLWSNANDIPMETLDSQAHVQHTHQWHHSTSKPASPHVEARFHKHARETYTSHITGNACQGSATQARIGDFLAEHVRARFVEREAKAIPLVFPGGGLASRGQRPAHVPGPIPEPARAFQAIGRREDGRRRRRHRRRGGCRRRRRRQRSRPGRRRGLRDLRVIKVHRCGAGGHLRRLGRRRASRLRGVRL